jgi:hypothetical protein
MEFNSPCEPQHPDAMGFAVADVDRAVGIDKDAVGAIERAGQWIAVGAVAFRSGAGNEMDNAGLRVDSPHGVTLSIGKPRVAGAIERDAFGTAECGRERGAAVAGETGKARARDEADTVRAQIQLEDLVSFAGDEPEIPIGIDVERAWVVERSSEDRSAVGRGAGFARSGDGGDDARIQIYETDRVIADIAHIQAAIRSELDAVRAVESGVLRGAAVAGVAAFLRAAGDGGDHAGLRVDAADGVVAGVRDEEISRAIETQLVREIERRL